jgi:hypothetical protein
MIEEEVLRRLAAVEHRQTWLLAAGVLVVLCLIGVLGFQVRALLALQEPQMLRVRQLAVVDEHGTERVLIGAPLPDPMILGKRHRRDGSVSGVIISDSTGTERGGYVTSDHGDNAMLTLDGQGFQTVLLLAEGDGSTTFRIWDRDKGSVTMGVLGNPFLNLKQNGASVFVAPPDNPQSRDARLLFR